MESWDWSGILVLALTDLISVVNGSCLPPLHPNHKHHKVSFYLGL